MTLITTSKVLIDKLKLIEKYSRKVTVSTSSLSSPTLKVNLNHICDIEFTTNTRDLIQMLEHTSDFEIRSNQIVYSYSVEVGGVSIECTRHFKLYEEKFDIPYADPRLSIVVRHFILLSSDDHSIEADSSGNFTISSNNQIETRTSFKGLNVAYHEVDKVCACVKFKDLEILREFDNEYIFSFFDDHLLIHILEGDVTNILLIPTLVR